MSFGGGSGGQIKYTITVEDAQAASALKSTGQQFKELGATTQSATQQMQAVPQTFQTIVQEGNKVTTTTKQMQQTMQGTVTTVTTATKANQSFGQVLKDNVLAIGVAASSIIGLISQYTSLRKAQIVAEKAASAEVTTRNRVIDLTNKLTATIAKYGSNSTQAAKGARDLEAAQVKAGIAAERNEVIQASLNERIAEFAVNILPNVIGSVTGVVQVLQNLSKGEKVSTVTTIENTAAQVANATATKLSGVAVKGLVPPLKAMATAEIAAGTAATVAGGAMRKALIRTGIGALLVAAGTALVAFAENWYGFRDAVNAAGVALGNFMPQLKPVLDFLGGTVGGAILSLFGVEIPKAAGKTGDALGEVGDAADQSAQEAIKAAEEIASAWKKTVDDLIVMPGSVHKEWKEQFQKLRKLGFTKGGIHELKDTFFRPAGIAKSITDSISEALQIVGKTKISGKSMKGLANNMIESINEGIKKAKGQLDFMSGLVDIIKANKKNVNLPKLVAEWFNGLPAALKTKLKDFGINPDEIVKTLGFDPATLKPALSSALEGVFSGAFGGLDPLSFLTINKDTMTSQVLGTSGGGGGWVSKIIESIKTAFSPANLESVRQQIVAGILAAPSNIGALAKQFIDPVIADILNAGVATLTQTIPDWIGRTFTAANLIAGLKTAGDLGTQFVTALWGILSNPAETGKQVLAFVGGVVDQIATGFALSLPKASATISKIFDNAVTWFQGLVDAAVEVGKTIPSTIAAWMAGIPDAISGIFNNAVSWFKGLLDAAIETAKAIPGSIGAWISQKAGDVITGAIAVGKKIGENIKTGVLSGLNFEANWLLSWFNTQTAEGAGGGGHRGMTPADTAGLITKSGTPPGQGQINQAVTQNAPQAQLNISTATANITRLIGNFMGYVGVVQKNNPIAQLNITTATANITRLIGNFGGWISVAAKESAVKLTITDATKNISRLIGNFGGWISVAAKESSAKLSITDATKNITRLIGNFNGFVKLVNKTYVIKVNNSSAMSAIGAVIKEMAKVKDKSVTLTTTHVNKIKTQMVAKGFHGVVSSPMNFTAGEAGPELVNVTPLSRAGTGGGAIVGRGTTTNNRFMGNSGDLIVNNIIDLGDDKIVRSFKRRLGNDRYTMGA